jgi:hypothetical protein
MTTVQEIEYTLENLIEELEYELEQANELKSKAVEDEDSHDELIKTANTQIAIIEAKLWQFRHKRNLLPKGNLFMLLPLRTG